MTRELIEKGQILLREISFYEYQIKLLKETIEENNKNENLEHQHITTTNQYQSIYLDNLVYKYILQLTLIEYQETLHSLQKELEEL